MSMWEFYEGGKIKPRGWLLRQLEIQAEGLNGNLDKVWPDVRDSAWVGGTREGWERVPYWLDGFVPLAYLLENEDMINRAKKYIDHILANQDESGWICPCPPERRRDYDCWAILLISKVLTVYYRCSGDERIPEVVYRVLKNFYDMLTSDDYKIHPWGKFRWFEGLIAINFIYKRTGEEWLVSLARMLRDQGTDYHTLTEKWKRPINRWAIDTHIVNIAMMFKYEAVSCEILGEEYQDGAQKLYDLLYKYNGTPAGILTGDECLSGVSPIQGTELCSVVELMYSFEHLFAETGDRKWAERLENVAFNALPATLSDDMWSHQYDQQSNQTTCETFPGKSVFRTNGPDANVFGLEPHYGCCTANFGQGWPKFALSAFMHKGDKITNCLPVPSQLDTGDVRIVLDTEYPFKNRLCYKIDSKIDFTFEARVPSFAKNVTVNGEESDNFVFAIKAGEQREIEINFAVTPEYEKTPCGLYAVRCGSLLFSVPVKYEKRMHEYEAKGVERRFPYCDYDYIPQSDWNFAYCGGELSVQTRELSSVPFSSEKPPVVIKTTAKRIDWGEEDGYERVCSKFPASTVPLSDAEEITLYPYGCAKLRMTELPIVE